MVDTKSMKQPPPTRKSAETARPKPRLHPRLKLIGAAEAALVAGADALAAQGLGGGGEAVEEIAADQEHVVEHRIGRERHVARSRAHAR